VKIVKPMALSFSFRTFLIVGKQELSVTCLVGFRMGPGVRRLVADIALWPAIGASVNGIVDEGLPKSRGEVLVYGSCHAPGGVPVTSSMVRVRIAAAEAPPDSPAMVEKKLAVFGVRYWEGTASRGPTDDPIPSTSKATAPVPFTEMALGWERAFGGPSYKKNPLGRGTERVETTDGIWRVPLPNVELPSHLVTSSSQRPEPAGFGPLDLGWPQRQSLAGTYDKRWLEEDFPGYSRTTDPVFFSTALPDQRIDGVFRGDEEYVLENMHPTAPVLSGRLPGAAARVLVRRKGSLDVEDVRMTLDTLVFLPGMEIGILVFRGLTPVVEDDAADIAFALAACEDLDAPRPTEHYARSLEQRLDKNLSPMLALNEDDLVPSFSAGSGLGDLLGKLKDPTKEVRERMVERALGRVRKQLVEAKVEDPDAVLEQMTAKSPLQERLERLPDPADPGDLAEYTAALDQLDAESEKQHEEMLKSVQEQLDKAEARLNEQLDEAEPVAMGKVQETRREAKAGLDRMRRMLEGKPPPEDASPSGEGPPKPRAPEMLEKTLEAYRLAERDPDPKVIELIQGADAKLLEMYRGSAHYAPAARLLDDDALDRARRTVLELRAAGTSLAELDWTRYDLSALDLRGADCRKILLEGADLSNANLAGADLSRAVLAHASLRETCFDDATLEGANLGSTTVDGTSFVGANLRKAIFARAQLRSVSFKGADLTGADWLEAELGAVDFEAAVVEGMLFLYKIKVQLPKRGQRAEDPIPSDLTRCRFPKARLKKATFMHSELGGVDFTDADLELVTFLSVKADGAIFRGARMPKLHAVMGCSLAGADFQGADLTGAFLRGANLRGANFEGARLDGADLSECDLTGAMLPRVHARDSFFIRSDLTGAKLPGADLMRAMMMKSKLYGADLSKSNLFAANLGMVRTDDATRVQGANLKRALMLPRAHKVK
jgi:uncharacterized protein YjbI with pentapeptide repeats